MNNSEGQTQEPVGGMKWEDVQILAKKHAEHIIEMGWRDNPDKDDIIADFISGYVSAPPPAPIKTDKQDDFNIAVDKAWEMHCRSIPEDSYNEEEYAELVAGKEIMFMTDFIEACHTYLYLPATPSPVGIDVEALAKEYADDIWESVPMEVQYIYLNLISAFKAGYSASLPQSSTGGLPKLDQPILDEDDVKGIIESQSSTEEEKELWKQAVGEVIKSEQDASQFMDWPDTLLSELQSQFKISKK